MLNGSDDDIAPTSTGTEVCLFARVLYSQY